MSSGLSCAAAPGALLHMHAIKCAVMKNATGDFGILTNLYKKGGVRTCMNNTYNYVTNIIVFKYKYIPPRRYICISKDDDGLYVARHFTGFQQKIIVALKGTGSLTTSFLLLMSL